MILIQIESWYLLSRIIHLRSIWFIINFQLLMSMWTLILNVTKFFTSIMNIILQALFQFFFAFSMCLFSKQLKRKVNLLNLHILFSLSQGNPVCIICFSLYLKAWITIARKEKTSTTSFNVNKRAILRPQRVDKNRIKR